MHVVYKKSFLCTLFGFLSYLFLLLGKISQTVLGKSFTDSSLHLYIWPQLLAVLFFLLGECYPYKNKKNNFLEKTYGFFLQLVLFIMISAKTAGTANTFYDHINGLDFGMLVVCWVFFALTLLSLAVMLVAFVLLLRGYDELNMKNVLHSASIMLAVNTAFAFAFEFLSLATKKYTTIELCEFSSCLFSGLMDAAVFYAFSESVDFVPNGNPSDFS